MRVIQNGPFLFLIILFTLFSLSIAGDTLNPNQSLANNETLISPGGMFALGFFSPPNSGNRYVGIWYHDIAIQTIVWVANRETPINDSTGILSIATNGSLIISTQNSTAVWSAAATGLRNPVAQLLDDGNFVVKEESGTDSDSFAWQSFDHPTDTLLPGMKLGVNLTSGLNRNLTAWKSSSDPSPGEYYGAMNIYGDPELFLWKGSQKLWRTGPWNGLQFSGVPGAVTYAGFTFTFVNNKEEVTYSYETADKSFKFRLVVNQSGVVQRSVWVAAGGVWNIFWYAPRDPCDPLSTCGPYGVCNPNDSPICDCLQGFTPKSPENWALRDMSGGCVRKTQLDCKNGTDGFAMLSGAKLPDTSNSTVDESRNLDECRAMCLKNCSCTAYASANISGGGSGCVMWFSELTDVRVFTVSSQVLYVRLAAADLGSSTNQSRWSGGAVIAVIISLVLVALFLAFVGFFLWRRRRKRRRASLDAASLSSHCNDERFRGDDLELPLFDLGTVAAVTDDFSIANKLGEGGFGPVYKGKLEDGQEIAVKRLAKTSVQGLDEFKTEVMLIAKLQHRNLVRLLGCCVQGEERMLIYEYMPNKSLDAILFDKEKSALLDWQTRYHIIQGIARGLIYLHHDSRFKIIHRDLKASNILLDKEMNPKISDFGMARIFGGDETEVNTRRVVGTYGYMSPEYAMDGIFSVKSDVFSFGVLVLEIISGKKNRGVYTHHSHLNVVGHAWSLWNEDKILQLVDESLGCSFPTNEVLKCIKVGLLCVQERPEDRPLMSSIVLMLGSDGAALPNPKQPGFVARRVPLEVESSSSKQDLTALNDMSITALQGR